MNKQNEIDIKLLNEFKNDKEKHIQKIELRISELIRLKNMLKVDIKNIENDIKELEINE